MDEEKRITFDISMEDISTDGEKIRIDSPKLAKILEAEKETRDSARKAVELAPIVPVIPLKEVSTERGKVTITSRELARVIQAEKKAQTKKISLVMAPTLPLPPP